MSGQISQPSGVLGIFFYRILKLRISASNGKRYNPLIIGVDAARNVNVD